MMKFQKKEVVAGLVLLCSASREAVARDFLPEDEDDASIESNELVEWGGPNILDVIIQDNEGATPPTPVNGG